jgi:hypothetical protein
VAYAIANVNVLRLHRLSWFTHSCLWVFLVTSCHGQWSCSNDMCSTTKWNAGLAEFVLLMLCGSLSAHCQATTWAFCLSYASAAAHLRPMAQPLLDAARMPKQQRTTALEVRRICAGSHAVVLMHLFSVVSAESVSQSWFSGLVEHC